MPDSSMACNIFGKGVGRTTWIAWLFYQGKATQSKTFWTTLFPKMPSPAPSLETGRLNCTL